jgi:glycosyltransferase involved in cell wall biosynthesis
MAASRPAVVIAPAESEISRAVEESGGGMVVRCGDTEGLVKALEGYASDASRAREHGARGRADLERRWSAAHALELWRGLLDSLGRQR